MTLTARNKLEGTVEEVVLGTLMAHVVVRVGDNLIESAITRRPAVNGTQLSLVAIIRAKRGLGRRNGASSCCAIQLSRRASSGG